MKKKLLIFFIILSLALTVLTGCTKNIYKLYTSAAVKTAQIQKASESVDFQLSIDPSGLTLTPEEQQMFSLYSNIKGTVNTSFDTKDKLVYADVNLGLSGLSLNFKVYAKDNKEIIQVPVINKYIVVDTSASATDSSKSQTELTGKVSDLLKQVVTKDNLKNNGDKKITVNDTSIDTTEYQFALNDADIKKIISGLADIVFANNQIKASIVNSIKAQDPSISDSEIEQQINQSKQQLQTSLNELKIDNLTCTGNIDKNSYIVQQNVSLALNLQIPDAGNAKANLSLTSKTSDIGKDVTVNLPATNSENSMTLEQFLNNSGSLLGGGSF